MNEVISYLMSYGLPVLALLLALAIVVLGIGLSTSIPRYFVVIFLFMILVVPQASSYGMESGDIGNFSILWVKGSKSFFFPFFDMLLASIWFFGVVIGQKWVKNSIDYSNPLSKWYIAFGFMFLGHLIVTMFGTKSLLYQLAGVGVINVIKQGMFVAILFATIRTERDIKLLFKFILICLAFNEFWGLFRYAFMGGDPQNIYETTEKLNVKITFFDINEHILACLMIGICTWKLLAEKITGLEKFAYSIMGAMALLVPLLSARRTAQFGVMLTMALLFILLPKGRRFPIILVLAIALPIGFASVAGRTKDPTKSLLEKVLLDVKTGDEAADPRKTRFYELETAWKTVKENPFFGVGPSGEFKVTSDVGLEYHKGSYGFVHSGYGHVLLKTGFVGLFIFLGIYIIFIINIFKGYKSIQVKHKALFVGCLSGLVSFVPTLQGGTPVIEIRTMLVTGFLMAIPLILIVIGKKSVPKVAEELFLNTVPMPEAIVV